MSDLVKRMSDLKKAQEAGTNVGTNVLKTATGFKIGGGAINPLAARLAKAEEARKAREAEAAAFESITKENRLTVMSDSSGSMCGEKMKNLHVAVVSLVDACDMFTTSISIVPFGDDNKGILGQTSNAQRIKDFGNSLSAHGGTPLHDAMETVLNCQSPTRCIIISDGDADDDRACRMLARSFKAAELKVDCVHIGQSSDGEELLRHIAEVTGGKYMKFNDSATFAKSIMYLSPAMRYILDKPRSEVLRLTGANDIS
jgi:Mg-chelatase subunit ChlD